LDPQNGRAYYRRAQARTLPASSGRIGDEELLALCDMRMAHSLAPENQEITRSYVSLSLAVDEHRKKERELYRRAFGKKAADDGEAKKKAVVVGNKPDLGEKKVDGKPAVATTGAPPAAAAAASTDAEKKAEKEKPAGGNGSHAAGAGSSSSGNGSSSSGNGGSNGHGNGHGHGGSSVLSSIGSSSSSSSAATSTAAGGKTNGNGTAKPTPAATKPGATKAAAAAAAAPAHPPGSTAALAAASAAANASIASLDEALQRIKEVEARAEQLRKVRVPVVRLFPLYPGWC